jgi:hypothetical protein
VDSGEVAEVGSALAHARACLLVAARAGRLIHGPGGHQRQKRPGRALNVLQKRRGGGGVRLVTAVEGVER